MITLVNDVVVAITNHVDIAPFINFSSLGTLALSTRLERTAQLLESSQSPEPSVDSDGF